MRNVVVTREMVSAANRKAVEDAEKADTAREEFLSNPTYVPFRNVYVTRAEIASSSAAIADTLAWIIGDGAPYGILSDFEENDRKAAAIELMKIED